MNREIVTWFSDYAAEIVRRFSDRVTKYFTLNEPSVLWGWAF